MKIWFDVITPKQARLMSAIALSLGAGHLITVKGLRESVELLKRLKVNYRVLGRYATSNLKDKLLAYAERVELLTDVALEYDPDALISFSSPEAVRVAFGLSIKSITMNDTPHSYHVGRLTFPLSWRVIYPEAIPEHLMIRLGASKDILVPYKGVDEVAWVKDFVLSNPPREREFKVFIRPEESGASYLFGKRGSVALELARVAMDEGAEVIVKPRYQYQVGALKGLKDSGRGRLTVLEEPVDTLELFSRISLVITGGGTMAREAALLGTPSLSVFPLNVKLHVNEYLEQRGFPIWRAVELGKAMRIVRGVLRDPDSYIVDTRGIISTLEDPRDVVSSVVGELHA